MKRDRVSISLTGSLLLVAVIISEPMCHATEPEVGKTLQVDTQPPAHDTSEQQIKSDRSGHVYFLWNQYEIASHDDAAYFRRSSTFGTTLDASTIKPDTTEGNPVNLGMCNDNGGYVYAVWDILGTNPTNTTLYFNQSSDAGATWRTQDMRIDHGEPPSVDYQTARIDCEAQGHIYVAWIDARGSINHIYFNQSSDYGTSWQSQDIQVDSSSSSNQNQDVSYPPVMTHDGKGNVYLVWIDSRSGSPHVFLSRSQDHGMTWQKEVQVDRAPEDTLTLYDAKVVCDEQGHVGVAWHDRRADHAVYFNSSSDFGGSWQAQDQRIDHTTSSEGVGQIGLASNGHGHVYGVWESAGDYPNPQKIFFNVSSDYGTTWGTSDMRIDAAPTNYEANYPRIVSGENNRVSITWLQAPYCSSDPCPGEQYVYFNTSSDYGSTWQPEGVRIGSAREGGLSGPAISADEVNGVYISWVAPGNDGYRHQFFTPVVLNHAPTIDPPLKDQVVPEGKPLTFKVVAKDAEGDPLTCTANNLPTWAKFDNTSCTFSGTPGYTVASVKKPTTVYTGVGFTVCDPSARCDTNTITITVTNAVPKKQ